jgi:Leucine-rich repeat (LRR) protein
MIIYWLANNLGVTSIEIRVPGITRLECIGNKLTKLPNNIDEIEDIICDNNEITVIPGVRHMDLNTLSCRNNKLTLLPIYITKLEQLYVSNNPLKNLLSVLEFGVNNQIDNLSLLAKFQLTK